MCGAFGAGNHVYFRLQSNTGHADRLTNAFLIIDHEFLRQYVQNFLVSRNRNCLRCINHSINVAIAYLLVSNSNDAVRVQAANVAAGNAGIHRMYVASRHQLRFFNRSLYAVNCRFDVDHDAFLEPAGRMGTDPDDFDPAGVVDLAYDRNDLRCSDIESDDQFLDFWLVHSASPSCNQFPFLVFPLCIFRVTAPRMILRRARAVFPADRKAVAVAHIDVCDFCFFA